MGFWIVFLGQPTRRLLPAAIRRPSPGGKAPLTSFRSGSELGQFSRRLTAIGSGLVLAVG